MNVEHKRKFLIDTAFIVLIAAIFYFVVKFCTIYLLPFVIGLILAVIVQKPANFIARKTKIKKGFISVIFVACLYLVTISLIGALCYLAYDLISSLFLVVKGYFPEISTAFSNLATDLTEMFDNLPPEFVNSMKDVPNTILTKVADVMGNFLTSTATTVAKSTPGILVSIIVTIVASCYIAKDYDHITNFIHTHTSQRVNVIISEIKEIFFKSVLKLFKSYLLLMTITFTELCLGFWIIGIKNPITVAAVVAIVDIMPVLGTGTVVIPWSIICMLLGDFWTGIALIALYLIVTVVRNFLEPKVIGDQIGIHPLVTLLAIFIGLRLFGVIGVIICPITLIIIVGLDKRGVINLFGKNNKTLD